MANISVTGVVLTFTVLFFTFPLCYARLRIPSQPENVINIESDFPISVLDSEVSQMIRLPIEEKSEFQLAEMLPETETGTYVITDMLTANDTGNNELAKKLPESVELVPLTEAGVTELVEKIPATETVTNEVSETVTVPSTPLRLARFRPVNRPCHHRHHRHHHLFPHGGNMVLPTGENGDFDRMIVHNQLHRIPPRWSSIPYLHHHHHHHHDDSNNEESNSVFKHHHHHDDSDNEESNSVFRRSARFNKEKFNKHFHHHDHEDHEHEVKNFNNRKVKNQNQNQNQAKAKENGLFNRIRKMMINF